MPWTLGTAAIYDRDAALDHLDALGLPAPPEMARANSLWCPLGRVPSRGWFLVSQADLSTLDLNALQTLTVQDGLGTTKSWNGLLFVKATCLTPGAPDAATAIYLVEVTDTRWICKNPSYTGCVSNVGTAAPGADYAMTQYNVPAPAFDTNTLPDGYYNFSLNGGALWTWTEMIQDLWNQLSTQLGSFPGLPAAASTDGNPNAWRLTGVSAWDALNVAVQKVGCDIACDLTKPVGSQYSIVQTGAADTESDASITTLTGNGLLLDDAQFVEGTRARIPYGVRVCFNVSKYRGSERAVDNTTSQYTSIPVWDAKYTESTTFDTNILHPLWDDLDALYESTAPNDARGIDPFNKSALITRANNRGADYFRRVSIGRLHKTFAGLQDFSPSSQNKAVVWSQGPTGAWQTEIFRHPFDVVDVNQTAGFVTSEGQSPRDSLEMRPPFLGPQFPIYPPLIEVVLLASGTRDGGSGYFDSYVRTFVPGSGESSTIRVWVDDIDGATTLTSGGEYLGRLVGFASSRPLYRVQSSAALPTVSLYNSGIPTYTNISKLWVDSESGGDLSQPADNQALIKFLAATVSQQGMVSTTTQTFGGQKTFSAANATGGVYVDLYDGSSLPSYHFGITNSTGSPPVTATYGLWWDSYRSGGGNIGLRLAYGESIVFCNGTDANIASADDTKDTTIEGGSNVSLTIKVPQQNAVLTLGSFSGAPGLAINYDGTLATPAFVWGTTPGLTGTYAGLDFGGGILVGGSFSGVTSVSGTSPITSSGGTTPDISLNPNAFGPIKAFGFR